MIGLRTDRLRIRELALGDADFILDLLNEPDFHRYIGDRGIRDREGAEKYLREGPLASYAKFGFGLWLVQREQDGAALGICGLLQRDYVPRPDLGFAFLARYGGQGYAFEAASAVLAYAHSVLKHDEVLAITAMENPRSIRLLEKLGFRPSGVIQTPVHATTSRLFTFTASHIPSTT